MEENRTAEYNLFGVDIVLTVLHSPFDPMSFAVASLTRGASVYSSLKLALQNKELAAQSPTMASN
jgi:hypothetical protein